MFKRTDRITDHENYKNYRNFVTIYIRKSATVERNKLVEKLKSNNHYPKDWWNTLKGFINPDLSGTILPLCKDGITYEENIDKANLLQTVLDERQSTLPHSPLEIGTHLYQYTQIHTK